MRLGRAAMLVCAACAGATLGSVAQAQRGGVVCGVLRHHPCLPTVCSPLHGRPCQPQYPFPLGENLQLTIKSTQSSEGERVDPDRPIDTIRDLFVALRACWRAPDEEEAHKGMQMSVRFAFDRNGGMIAAPRVTYATPGVRDETRQLYRQAIDKALDRCTPMPFSRGMGGAIAGRPIAVRYVDNRQPEEEHQP